MCLWYQWEASYCPLRRINLLKKTGESGNKHMYVYICGASAVLYLAFVFLWTSTRLSEEESPFVVLYARVGAQYCTLV